MLRLALLLGLAATLTLPVEGYGSRASSAARASSASRASRLPAAAATAAESCEQPPEYHAPGTYEDTDEFWAAFDQSLQDNNCDNLREANTRPCRRFINDFPYIFIVNYLRQACFFGFSNPAYLRVIVLQYCLYHSTDGDVDSAYDCSTGCQLADNLNQLCQDINNPVTTTTPEPTTTTTNEPTSPCIQSSEQATCGSTFIIDEGDKNAVLNFEFPCTGYPRDTDPCIFNITVADTVPQSSLDLSGLRVRFNSFDVTCADGVTVYEGEVSASGTLAPSSCNDNSPQGITFSTTERSILIVLDLEEGVTSGSGFSVPYIIC